MPTQLNNLATETARQGRELAAFRNCAASGTLYLGVGVATADPDGCETTRRPTSAPTESPSSAVPSTSPTIRPCTRCRNCADHLAHNPSLPSGAYTVVPSGAGGGPYELAAPSMVVYCDMTGHGGGWTLVCVTSWLEFWGRVGCLTLALLCHAQAPGLGEGCAPLPNALSKSGGRALKTFHRFPRPGSRTIATPS